MHNEISQIIVCDKRLKTDGELLEHFISEHSTENLESNKSGTKSEKVKETFELGKEVGFSMYFMN